jgi:hypothetical protein
VGKTHGWKPVQILEVHNQLNGITLSCSRRTARLQLREEHDKTSTKRWHYMNAPIIAQRPH